MVAARPLAGGHCEGKEADSGRADHLSVALDIEAVVEHPHAVAESSLGASPAVGQYLCGGDFDKDPSRTGSVRGVTAVVLGPGCVEVDGILAGRPDWAGPKSWRRSTE